MQVKIKNHAEEMIKLKKQLEQEDRQLKQEFETVVRNFDMALYALMLEKVSTMLSIWYPVCKLESISSLCSSFVIGLLNLYTVYDPVDDVSYYPQQLPWPAAC